MTLAIGETIEIQGSGSKPYKVKNIDGKIWSCSCPGWRFKSTGVLRTCKHITALLGADADAQRLGSPISPATIVALTTKGPVNVPVQITPSADRSVAATKHAAGTKLRQDEKAKLFGPKLLLANDFRDFPDLDPTGWWYSEKLDGCRSIARNGKFTTRQGNQYFSPGFFTDLFPNDIELDGELFYARGKFEETMSIVRSQESGDRWTKICFIVFDAPGLLGPFEERLKAFTEICEKANSPYLKAHPHFKARSRKHIEEELVRIEVLGGEGLMLRQPGSLYERCRSNTLLKYKPFRDTEAVVTGHTPGKGKHKGQLGALVGRTPDGKEFNLGTGLTDAERRNPPPIGCIITYSYTGLTNSGLPKCCAFIRIRPEE
jgi:DNA ligase-1